jgi:type I restriction enzyme S subunit
MSLVVPFDEIFSDFKGLLAKHDSWERIELGHACTITNGFPFKSALFNKEKGTPVVRIRDLSKGATATLFAGKVPDEVYIDDGDLLIGMDGIFACYEWHGGRAGLNQRVCKIVSDDRFLNRRFLLFGINGYLKAIEEATSSVTVGHLSSRDILRIPFPLPPINEQRRIVAKLEKLLDKVDSCQKRLAKIPILLKRFRQAVLEHACSGRLIDAVHPCPIFQVFTLA